jgi:hypothetical protein
MVGKGRELNEHSKNATQGVTQTLISVQCN